VIPFRIVVVGLRSLIPGVAMFHTAGVVHVAADQRLQQAGDAQVQP
jgi:hypothetical protein